MQGARRAVAAGFDAVELHGVHGYLLGQFLSPFTNQRTDEWGGSLENRARFALEVVRGIRAEIGPDHPLMYRLSVTEPYEGGLSPEDGLAFCRMLETYVDALDVSAGNYDTATPHSGPGRSPATTPPPDQSRDQQRPRARPTRRALLEYQQVDVGGPSEVSCARER